MRCRFCDDEAVAIFVLNEGCFVFPNDREQALCMHHVLKATPIGSIELAKDLTENEEFTDWWTTVSEWRV